MPSMRSALSVALLVFLLVGAGCAGRGSPAVGGTSLPASSAASGGGPALTGQVLDEELVPLAGADVLVGAQDPLFTMTDNDGRFAFNDLLPGKYRVTAQMAGYEPKSQDVTVVYESTSDAKFTLRAIPAPVPRASSFIAEAIIERGVNAFGIYYYDNASGTQYRDIYYPVTPDARSTVIGLQWQATSPASAKWMHLAAFVSDAQCNTYCFLADKKEGRSPLVARHDNLELFIQGRSGFMVNPFIAIAPPCGLATPTDCTQAPDAVVQVAQDQRFNIYTHVFYVDPAPAGFNPFPPA